MRSLEEVQPGDTLGRYELLVPIAQGGMAAVWAARLKGSRGFQKTVAIKTILPNLVDDAQFEQMFLDEAGLASRIRHPNVAQIQDLGEENEVLYLVMEWVDGEALSVLMRTVNKATGKPIPIAIASRMVMQACAGLHAAHELRDDDGQSIELVHRDVSPQNILVTYDGAVKIVDFGVAKAVGRTAVETSAGQLKGKVPFMSPEQARGGRIDRRTDIFALGALYYQLVCGTHPFRGDNDLVTLNNIITRPAFRPRLNDPTFPAPIEEVLMTALAKDVTKRYATMSDFEAGIGAALSKLGMTASDKQVADFMHAAMGDRAKKRREALKQAMKAADDHVKVRQSQRPPSGIGPVTSPSVMTPISDRMSQPEISAPTTLPNSRVTAPTLAAVSSSGSPAAAEEVTPVLTRAPGAKKRTGILVGGVAVAGVVVVVGIAALSRTGNHSTGSTGAGLSDTVPAASSAPVAALPAPSASVAAAADSAAPPADVVAHTPSSLPLDTPDPGDSKGKSGSGAGSHAAGQPNAAATGAPTTAPTTTAAATATATSRRKVPEVQNPGF